MAWETASYPRHELSQVRSEAFYEADEKHGDNPQVVATRNSGIRARVFASRTPTDILTHLVFNFSV